MYECRGFAFWFLQASLKESIVRKPETTFGILFILRNAVLVFKCFEK
jgi:hypothetical protein